MKTNKFSIMRALVNLFSFTAIRFAHQDAHKYEMFKGNVEQLMGEHPAHSVLSHLCRDEEGGGKGVWLDSIDAANSDDSTRSALTAKDTRMEFHQKASGDQTFANYLLTKTPANDVQKIRTQSLPKLNEWGHYFDEDEGWQHLTDPKGTEVNVGVTKIHKGRDIDFMLGVTAATVQRQVNGAALGAVSLPASQALDDITSWDDFTVDNVPSLICEKFDNVWFAKGQPLYCCISGTAARHMRRTSRNTIHSQDFVSSYADLQQGTIPQIDGVTFIVVPYSFLQNIAGSADDTYFAWTPMGVAKVNYSPFKTDSGTSPDHRFDTAVYMREKYDFVRTDDLGVVVGDVAIA